MDVGPPADDRGVDRRVRRSRAALMRAAVTLVAERGTTLLTVSDIAEAADVSRQLLYQQFGDRDTLLLEAARDLAQRELVSRLTERADVADALPALLAVTAHFAEHRSFYRPMLIGPCAYGLSTVLHSLLSPFNRRIVRLMSDQQLAPGLTDDLTRFVTGGSAAVFNSWMIESPDPLDAEAFAERLMRILSVIVGSFAPPITTPDNDIGTQPCPDTTRQATPK